MLARPSESWLLLSSYKSKSRLLGDASCEFVRRCAYSISHANFILQVSDPERYLIDVKPREVNALANQPLSRLQKASQTPVATAQEQMQMGGPHGQPSFPYGFYPPPSFTPGHWYQPPPAAGSAMFSPYGIQVGNELGSTDSSHLHDVIAESTDGRCAGPTSNSTYGRMP